jgi:predicted nucleotidyltransferase
VVVSEPVPPPLVPPELQADNANGKMAKLAAKALAQIVLDKLEVFTVVFPLKVVNFSGS